MPAVDPRNPEVRDNLAAWFEKRDELFELRSDDRYITTDLLDKPVADLLEELVDIADELVAFFCPTAADQQLYRPTEENP